MRPEFYFFILFISPPISILSGSHFLTVVLGGQIYSFYYCKSRDEEFRIVSYVFCCCQETSRSWQLLLKCHCLTTPVNQESCNGNSASRGYLWPEKEEKEPLVSNLSRLAELRKGHLPSCEVTGLLACHQCHLSDQAYPT